MFLFLEWAIVSQKGRTTSPASMTFKVLFGISSFSDRIVEQFIYKGEAMYRSSVPEERTIILPILKSDLNGQSVSVCKKCLSFSMNNSCGRGAIRTFPFFAGACLNQNAFHKY